MSRAGRRTATSVLTALGLSPEDERRYQQLLPLSGGPVEDVATVLGTTSDHLSDGLSSLLARGLVSLRGGRLHVPSLPALVSQLIDEQAESASRARERLHDLSQAIPFLVASSFQPGPGQMEDLGSLDGELSAGGNALTLLTDLIETSKGDLLWWRPDAWRMPRESAISVVVGRAVASGRRSRAIYPIRALHEAPEVLQARARQGEQVRVIDEMPTRMLVIQGTHAVLPEPLGFADEPRLLVRQPALVGALALLFEAYWDQATALPDLDARRPRVDIRGNLLRQLAAGAKDEQIARTLGLSLRTVRRRVAELMIELGVDTRFQAGVEAVRRGWL
ncbi:MAG: helix-turn-helix domain-containing protein [Nocardioides sp.]